MFSIRPTERLLALALATVASYDMVQQSMVIGWEWEVCFFFLLSDTCKPHTRCTVPGWKLSGNEKALLKMWFFFLKKKLRKLLGAFPQGEQHLPCNSSSINLCSALEKHGFSDLLCFSLPLSVSPYLSCLINVVNLSVSIRLTPSLFFPLPSCCSSLNSQLLLISLLLSSHHPYFLPSIRSSFPNPLHIFLPVFLHPFFVLIFPFSIPPSLP